MRPIKFRAWSKKDKCFLGACAIHMETGLFTTCLPPDREVEWEEVNNDESDVILMQFTGLKDKNGVDIFEGDVMRVIDSDRNRDFKTKVYFTDGYFAANTLIDRHNNLWTPNGLAGLVLNDNTEVIGNLYENPELLIK